MRVLVVWCPDWSVVAALREAEQPATLPAAVLAAGVVEVCNGPAREEGVRRGQRRRDAQSRCPELLLLEASPDRDARHFEPVLETVEALRPGVAALRPGLLAVRAPGRYFGGEANAAAVFAETLVESGVWDCRLGVADDLFTAEQAARRARVQECELVAEGGSAGYLRELLVEVLAADGPDGREMVGLLRRLGLRTLGDLAALPSEAVQHRFGSYGARVWRRARGEAPTLVAPRTPPPDLTAEISFEPPLDSVEAVCFSVRTTAERLVADLASRQLVATGVRVEAEHDGAVASARTSPASCFERSEPPACSCQCTRSTRSRAEKNCGCSQVRADATAPSCSASTRTPVATSCREARSATSRSAVVRTLKQTASTESSGGSKEISAARSGGGVRAATSVGASPRARRHTRAP